jgi:hypothetical protein
VSRWRLGVSVVLLLGMALAFSLARGRTKAPAAPALRPTAAPPLAHAVPTPAASPAALRDVFRFAGEPASGRSPGAGSVPLAPRRPEAVPTPPPGPRLVGLLRRGGKLVAALGLGGEVELAVAGGSAGGVQVLAVDEDGVRIRRPDGSEATLRLE